MQINININKAKEIWKEKIRADREPYFVSLDVSNTISIDLFLDKYRQIKY